MQLQWHAVMVVCSAHDLTALRMSLADDNYLHDEQRRWRRNGRACVACDVILYGLGVSERRDP